MHRVCLNAERSEGRGLRKRSESQRVCESEKSLGSEGSLEGARFYLLSAEKWLEPPFCEVEWVGFKLRRALVCTYVLSFLGDVSACKIVNMF